MQSIPYLSTGHLTSIQSCLARSNGKAPVNAPFISQRLPYNRGYSAVAMEKSYEAAVTGTMSVRRAAEEFGVPRSTLHEKVTGKVALQVKRGS